MRRYLAELHKKPDHHKRRFALLASSIVTLFIFGFWSLATLPPYGLADESPSARDKINEVSPFESLRMSLAAAVGAFRNNFRELKTDLEVRDLESGYKEMRDNSLNIYGQ
ncbi:MAG: hypothetical protein Q8P21_00365 [bacterium]|nr:hypothetical protein [bacterium]